MNYKYIGGNLPLEILNHFDLGCGVGQLIFYGIISQSLGPERAQWYPCPWNVTIPSPLRKLPLLYTRVCTAECTPSPVDGRRQCLSASCPHAHQLTHAKTRWWLHVDYSLAPTHTNSHTHAKIRHQSRPSWPTRSSECTYRPF